MFIFLTIIVLVCVCAVRREGGREGRGVACYNIQMPRIQTVASQYTGFCVVFGTDRETMEEKKKNRETQ